MGAVLRDSTLYSNLFTNKYPGDARDYRGRVVPLRFELTVVSPSTTLDTYNLTVIPAYHTVVGLECTTDGLGASGGAGRTVALGDSGDNDRYMLATDFDVVNAQGTLAAAGQGYTPTADTIVVALFTNAPVVGRKIKGVIWTVANA